MRRYWSAGGRIDTREVQTITLNDLLPRTSIKAIDFLTMDIELAEPLALAGFDIARYRPRLVCIEAQDRVRQQILNYFADHGYVIAGRYWGVDPMNLYFVPRSTYAAAGAPQ